jgi:D-alanyl-D-alanine carboxypeptidase
MTETAAATRTRHAGVSPAVHERLTSLLDRVGARRRSHHASFAIATGDGSRRWSGATGAADGDGTPFLPETPFFVASVTKRFIATLILQAHERREVDLDDPIVTHLPPTVTDGLHVLGGVDHTPQITVRHLLSHTSGLPDYWDRPRGGTSLYRQLGAGHDRAWDLDDVVRMARDEHEPHFVPQDLTAPKQRARYSDTGFQLLIAIAERATGRSYASLLHERILAPLGLEHTWLPGRSTPAAPTAAPATVCAKDRPLTVPMALRSCNDLASTTGDLLRFQRALLVGELFTEPETVSLLRERANRLHLLPIRYGLGTMQVRVSGLYAPGRRPVTLVGHSGATGTWLFHCPEYDLHLTGTVDQIAGRATPFRLMARMLRAWGV